MAALRNEGWFVFKIHGSAYMMAGLPDLVVCAEGRFIGLETKMPEKRSNVSPRQKIVLAAIVAAGGVSAVVCSPEEAVTVVKGALE
jgi:Holliday junction resolvase